MKIILDYIWLDGNTISDVRYITKIIDADIKMYNGIGSYFGKTPRLLDQREDTDKIPSVTINGNLTNQKTENNNVLTLKPVKLYSNPLKTNSYYVICESYDGDSPHESNSRFALSSYLIDKDVPNISLVEGFALYENGYDTKTIYNKSTEHLNKDAYSSRKTGYENLVDDLVDALNNINVNISSITNMYNQSIKWEIETKEVEPMVLADDILVLRHLLYRLAIKYNVLISFDRKFFTEVKSEKDEINDPYLLCKKNLKSLNE